MCYRFFELLDFFEILKFLRSLFHCLCKFRSTRVCVPDPFHLSICLLSLFLYSFVVFYRLDGLRAVLESLFYARFDCYHYYSVVCV